MCMFSERVMYNGKSPAQVLTLSSDGMIYRYITISECKIVILVLIQFLMYRYIVYRNNRMC